MTSLEELDSQWLKQARARVAAGGAWERTPAEVERAALALRDGRHEATAGALACPYCEHHPPLEVFRRYETVTHTPLRYCPNCCGFWAAGDSLSRGVADPNTDHPALRAGLPPRRCTATSSPTATAPSASVRSLP